MMHAMIPTPLVILIVAGYLVIAAQFFVAARGSESNAGKKALWLLIGIFILCALAGYAPRIFPFLMPYELAIHVALILATWWFIFTNQAAHIMKALK